MSEQHPAFSPPAGRRTIPVRTAYAPAHRCSPAVRARVLRETPLFQDLSTDELRAIDARMTNVHAEAGALLQRQGEEASAFSVLAAGRLKTYRTGPDGQRVVVDLLGSGDAFGGADSFGRRLHAETVEALTSVCVLRIDSAGFHRILREYPAVALRLVDELAGQLMATRDAVSERSTTVGQRVAATLLRLAERFGEEDDGGILLQLPLSRSDLADMTGSTPESVSRAMSQLRGAGLVESGRRWTRILDAPGLRAAADARD